MSVKLIAIFIGAYCVYSVMVKLTLSCLGSRFTFQWFSRYITLGVRRKHIYRIAVIALLAALGSIGPFLSFAQQETNSLIGVFTEAPGSSKFVGGQVTITGLSTQEPTTVWPDGYDTKMKKIFANSNLIILQSVGAVGSTDTLYIETKNKRFLVVSVGAMAIVINGNPVTLSQYRGYLK